jgi:hypothetical protein
MTNTIRVTYTLEHKEEKYEISSYHLEECYSHAVNSGMVEQTVTPYEMALSSNFSQLLTFYLYNIGYFNPEE